MTYTEAEKLCDYTCVCKNKACHVSASAPVNVWFFAPVFSCISIFRVSRFVPLAVGVVTSDRNFYVMIFIF